MANGAATRVSARTIVENFVRILPGVVLLAATLSTGSCGQGGGGIFSAATSSTSATTRRTKTATATTSPTATESPTPSETPSPTESPSPTAGGPTPTATQTATPTPT
ncbi:MAG: hypothetical protein ACREQI_04960 [Candidatus Binataceae bacterium]